VKPTPWRRAKTAALGWIGSIRRRALVLTYHRVADPPFDPNFLSVSPVNFAAHMEIVRRKFAPVSLTHLVARLREGALPRRSVVITFDDGYADNLTFAKPILERHGVPATVFVTTGPSRDGGPMWPDRLVELLFEPRRLPQTLSLPINGREHRWDLAGADYATEADYQRHRRWKMGQPDLGPRESTYRAVHELLRRLPGRDRDDALAATARWAGGIPASATAPRCLTAGELRSLSRGGLIEIGGHTVSHPSLAALPEAEQWREVIDCRRAMEEALGVAITSFAYPYGGRDDFNDVSVRALRRAGFECACTTAARPVAPADDCFQIPRFHVNDCDANCFERALNEWMLG
jgi:peptidoglycan/xylan/chitin deacetylase (PgdA/CDA1 family)